MAKIDEKRIAQAMKALGISRDEAIEMFEYDDSLQDGQRTEYDLTPEQEKNVREMNRKVEHAKSGKTTRERKPNELKEAIVREIAEFLTEDALGQAYEDVSITNANRMIAFTVGDKHFELTLVEKRPSKK